MPSNHPTLGALPARFRRERLLVIGCGDVGLRVARALPSGMAIRGLTSSSVRAPLLRQTGITPLTGNLDNARSIRRLAGIATRLIYLAPPPVGGEGDPRVLSLLRALRGRGLPRSVVYASTSGVYGDCGGAWVTETRALKPATARARRRVDAEAQMRWWGRATGVRTALLRIPGIYAPNREGGNPVDRVRQATPVLRAEDDVFTNHIHADDLARICLAALWRSKPQRVYNAVDDTDMRTGEYLDAVAAISALPPPPRISRSEALQTLSPQRMSFLSESRRLSNHRMKSELRVRLRYPTVLDGVRKS